MSSENFGCSVLSDIASISKTGHQYPHENAKNDENHKKFDKGEAGVLLCIH